MKLTCLIQNDNQDEFSFSKNLNFGEDDHDHHPGCGKVLDITIGAQCKRDIFVKYQPSNLGESEANLVLKPHGIARDKKTLKSKVQLKAYHFESYKVAIGKTFIIFYRFFAICFFETKNLEKNI